jgi:formate/nitrite transporter
MTGSPRRIDPGLTDPPLHPTGLDAYAPAQIARLVDRAGVAKARLPLLPLMALGCLAGAFIALGAMFYLAVLAGWDLAFGPARVLAGMAFSLGLILVIVGGGELFTGNALLVIAWVERRITSAAVARNWVVVYVANFIGAAIIVALAWAAGLAAGDFGATAAAVAARKLELSTDQLIARGVLCNVLVCLAVWLSFAARDAAGKVLVIVPPIAAFVALGLEHSVANMFLLPFGLIAGAVTDVGTLARHFVWVTLGNVIGGGVLVGLTYRAAYRPVRWR